MGKQKRSTSQTRQSQQQIVSEKAGQQRFPVGEKQEARQRANIVRELSRLNGTVYS